MLIENNQKYNRNLILRILGIIGRVIIYKSKQWIYFLYGIGDISNSVLTNTRLISRTLSCTNCEHFNIWMPLLTLLLESTLLEIVTYQQSSIYYNFFQFIFPSELKYLKLLNLDLSLPPKPTIVWVVFLLFILFAFFFIYTKNSSNSFEMVGWIGLLRAEFSVIK